MTRHRKKPLEKGRGAAHQRILKRFFHVSTTTSTDQRTMSEQGLRKPVKRND